MTTAPDHKWITEGPDFAFTDNERWEITNMGDGFALRENTAHADPDGADPDWEPIDEIFGSMEDAKAYADMGRVNGWTFDPSREVWQAKTGPATWSEVSGALNNPPTWAPCAN